MGASSDNKTISNFNDLETETSFKKKNLRIRVPNNTNPLKLIYNQYFPETSMGNDKKYKSFKKYNRKIKYSFTFTITLAIQLESGLIAFSDYNSEILEL